MRAAVSLTGQLASVDEDLTGRENLILLGRLLGLKRRAAKERATSCSRRSGSPRPRAGWSSTTPAACGAGSTSPRASWSRRELMFLDEPTTGLDPRSRNQVWDIIRALVAGGTTILLCTQYLEEADQLADGIAVIDHGKVIAEGTPGAAQGVGRLGRAARAPARSRAAARRPSGSSSAELGAVHLEADPAALSVLVRRRRPGRRGGRRARALGRAASPTSRSASRASTRSSWP